MNVYDQAHHLAKAVKNSQEYTEYRAALQKVEANPDYKKLLQDYQKKQFQLQQTHMMGRQISEDKKQDIQKLHEILAANPVMSAYITAEYRFGRMMADVQTIIVDGLDIAPHEQG